MAHSAPETPADLSKRSWTATLKRTVQEFRDDNVTDWSAALTYYAVLALFPALIALVAIVGLVADPATITNTLTKLVSSIGPASAVDTFKGPIQQITANRSTAGIALVVSLATALWAASGYIGAFMRASNAIYEVGEGRPFWKLRPLQMVVTLVMVLLVAVTVLALVVTGPLASAVGDAVGLGATAVTIWDIAKWPVLIVVVLGMFGFLYHVSPNVRLPKFTWVTPGSVLALVTWVVASALFAFYVANFGSYNKTYGALGGIITFLVWLWISNIAVLLGAEFNAELERGRRIEEGMPADREPFVEPRDTRKMSDEGKREVESGS
jgi:membrane protein